MNGFGDAFITVLLVGVLPIFIIWLIVNWKRK